jgi:hypothetical protein
MLRVAMGTLPLGYLAQVALIQRFATINTLQSIHSRYFMGKVLFIKGLWVVNGKSPGSVRGFLDF